MPLHRYDVVGIDNLKGYVVGVSDVHDHRVEGGERVVSVKFDGVHLEEGLMYVGGDLAHVIGAVLGEVGILHVFMWEALLRHALRVGVGMDGGDGVEPQLLND